MYTASTQHLWLKHVARIWDMSCSSLMEMLWDICQPILPLETQQISIVCYSRERPEQRETGLDKLAVGMMAIPDIPAREPVADGILAIIFTS